MDGDIDSPAAVVDYLNHLLVAVALWHAYQTTEFADAMIYMDHEIAYFKLLNLFQRERDFAAAGLVGTQTVFMETVEYLVVGEDAESQVVVDKSLVDGFFYRGEV